MPSKPCQPKEQKTSCPGEMRPSAEPRVPSEASVGPATASDSHSENLHALSDEMRDALRELAPQDSQMIEKELRGIYQARLLVLTWLEDLETKGCPKGIRPTQFLRAWGDSVGRIIQLVRARQRLLREVENWITALLADVRVIIDQDLPELEGGAAKDMTNSVSLDEANESTRDPES